MVFSIVADVCSDHQSVLERLYRFKKVFHHLAITP